MTDLETRLAGLVPTILPPPLSTIDAGVARRRTRRRVAGALAAVALVLGGGLIAAALLGDDSTPIATEREHSSPALWELAERWEDGTERVAALDHGLWLEAEVFAAQLCVGTRYGELEGELPPELRSPRPTDRRACTLPVLDERLLVLAAGTGYGSVNTSLVGAVARDEGAVVLRFPNGEERDVEVMRVARWPGLGVFGVSITWDDASAPEVVLVGPDGRDVEVHGAGPVTVAAGPHQASPAFEVQEMRAGDRPLGSLPDGRYFGRLSGFVDDESLAAILFVPGEVRFGDEAEAAHAESGDEHVDHPGIWISPDWEPPVLVPVGRERARFDVLDARWDPSLVEVGWDELASLLRGTHVFPLYWTGLVHLTVTDGQIAHLAIQYMP